MSDQHIHECICARLVELHDSMLTVTLAGQIKFEATVPVQQFLTGLFAEHKPQCMIVDCHDVTFVDSQGLAMLLQVHNACRAAGSTLSLRDPSPFLRDLLRLTRIDTYMQVV
ncbi:STAS domain-containing protein [bacterium]|nr:STAS domain-containing protein [bacterium]